MALTPEEQQRLEKLNLILPKIEAYYTAVTPIIETQPIEHMIGWLVWDEYKAEKIKLDAKK